MSGGFDLPFQWDDGEHFAPVVFTKEEELQTVTDIILDSYGTSSSSSSTSATTNEEKDQQKLSSSTTSHQQQEKENKNKKKKVLQKLPSGPLQDGETFIDAGCGNGRVPLYVAAKLQSLVNNNKPKNNKVLGIDIEEDLIEKANAEAKSLGFSPENVKFIAGDLKKSVDLLCSCHFIYCYLLPGDLLTDLMNRVTEHWKSNGKNKNESKRNNTRVIISHTWEISCLDEYVVGRAGEFWVYDRDVKKE